MSAAYPAPGLGIRSCRIERSPHLALLLSCLNRQVKVTWRTLKLLANLHVIKANNERIRWIYNETYWDQMLLSYILFVGCGFSRIKQQINVHISISTFILDSDFQERILNACSQLFSDFRSAFNLWVRFQFVTAFPRVFEGFVSFFYLIFWWRDANMLNRHYI